MFTFVHYSFLIFDWLCSKLEESTKLIFLALPDHYKDPILAEFTTPQATFWKKTPPKSVTGITLYKFWFTRVHAKK